MLQVIYKTYLIERHGTANDGRTGAYLLVAAPGSDSSSEHEAEEWIRDNGYQNTEYTILPVYTRR